MENVDDYKAVIITGKNDKSDDIDGEMKFIGSLSNYEFHIDCLLDYARENYPGVKVFQRMNDRFDPNVPIFFLTWLNSIVYINISGNRLGRYGMLYLPDEISDKQKEKLLMFAKSIPKAHVDIVYDLDIEDGLVEWKEFNYDKNKKFYELLNDFLNNYEKKPKI